MPKVGQMKNKLVPCRGDIFWVKLDPTIGAEINKTRPCLVVSNDQGNKASRSIIVAPITSTVTKIYPFEVEIELKQKCKILLRQLRAIDKIRLADYITTLDYETMTQIDVALRLVLDLD